MVNITRKIMIQFFKKNVKLDYLINIINRRLFRFLNFKKFNRNFRNVVYKNLKNTMKADVVEIDIKNKN